jgi:hypothetical protein
MNGCENYIEQISALLDGELSPEQEAVLRTHIEGCADCRRVYDAFQGISGALSEELVKPPETLARGVMYKIERQKKGAKRYMIGRFTAIAACFALILFGAAHFGLLDGAGRSGGAAPKMALRSAGEEGTAQEDAVVPEIMEVPAADSGQGETKQTTGDTPNSTTEPPAPAVCPEGSVLQFGFAGMSLADTSPAEPEADREPAFLFEAKELQIYEGRYYALENEKAKNKLLVTLTTEEEREALYTLVTAMPDNAVAYTPEDGEILKSDPLFTLFVPANTEKDKAAKDKLIRIWFVNKEVWCVVSDAEPPVVSMNLTGMVQNNIQSNSQNSLLNNSQNGSQNSNAGKIIYKAEGMKDKFEAYVKTLKETYNIT